ncbi:MAG: hypothetical protein Kow00108_23390 [Calditrichia bacterium]
MAGEMTNEKKGFFKKFPFQFWLVVIFEFFERGSYYGMMSILSVYFTEQLHFAKESVGIIKGTIQPLLYFLPIIAGALADRFGYRKTLMLAFALMGTGYFLTAQATSYALVFGALVIMGFGAGTFKPIISGTIARVTDESNSTLGFGIFYWSINLGAFLFPLILVPMLKKIDWSYVIVASAICTSILIIPTFFFFKDPVKQEEDKSDSKKPGVIQTLANAFEIIYSPIVLVANLFKKSGFGKILASLILLVALIYSTVQYLQPLSSEGKYASVGVQKNNALIIVENQRNELIPDTYSITPSENDGKYQLILYKPDRIETYFDELQNAFLNTPDSISVTLQELQQWVQLSDKKVHLFLKEESEMDGEYSVTQINDLKYEIEIKDLDLFPNFKDEIYQALALYPALSGISENDLNKLAENAGHRPFFLLFVSLTFLVGLIIVRITHNSHKEEGNNSPLPMTIIVIMSLFLWFIPGLTMLGRIITFVIFLSISSLIIIDKSDSHKFADHAKFLLMIFLYSGFWILYFQMFDSVLWYVQAYVNAATLNDAVNTFLGWFGININWFFDVEHVTVINAGTIILLQLFISNLVKHTKALPTMIVGITIATIGMAILAISTDIWIFLIGIILFSIGEMTTHPKFISYIGLVAPADKKAMYMGYLFLYGVFGSSIGGILGAKLYVHFVDNLNQPKVLWLVFSGIGVATIIALLLYNKFLAPSQQPKKS